MKPQPPPLRLGPNVQWLVDGALSRKGGPVSPETQGLLFWSKFTSADLLELAAWCLAEAGTSKTPEINRAYDDVTLLATAVRLDEDLAAIVRDFDDEVTRVKLTAVAYDEAGAERSKPVRQVPYVLTSRAREDAMHWLKRPLSEPEAQALEACIRRCLTEPAS